MRAYLWLGWLLVSGCNCQESTIGLGQGPEGGVLDASTGDAVLPDAEGPTDLGSQDGSPHLDASCASVIFSPTPPICGASLCGNGRIDRCQSCQFTCGPAGDGGGGTCMPRTCAQAGSNCGPIGDGCGSVLFCGDCTAPASCGGGGIPNQCGGNVDAGPPPPPADAGCCQAVAETCDGTDLNGVSCEALGYAGGALACNTTCGFDTRACTSCVADPRIHACGTPSLDAPNPIALALATRDQTIAVAWIDGVNLGPAEFAILGPDFSYQGAGYCGGAADARRVALAAVPGGWLLAVDRVAGSDLILLGPGGATVATHSLPLSTHVVGLAESPNSGPLMLSIDQDGTSRASWLDSTGNAIWSLPLFLRTVEPEYGSAVFTGDGFLIAERTAGGGVTLVHVDLSGQPSMPVQPLGTNTEYPQLSWNGTEARLSWADFSRTPTLLWARLSSQGVLLSAPVSLGPGVYGPAPMLALADRSALLLPAASGQTGRAAALDLATLDATGMQVSPLLRLNRDPSTASNYRLAPLGTELVAAWISNSMPARLVLSRFAP